MAWNPGRGGTNHHPALKAHSWSLKCPADRLWSLSAKRSRLTFRHHEAADA